MYEHRYYDDEYTGALGREFNADLTEYYPAPAQASPNGRGAPAAPAAAMTPVGRGVAMSGAPALWVLAFAAVSLILLHKA